MVQMPIYHQILIDCTLLMQQYYNAPRSKWAPNGLLTQLKENGTVNK